MCGIFGVYLYEEDSNAYQYILNGLSALQHRGQDSSGIYTMKKCKYFFHKNNGKVGDVFKEDYSNILIGNIGIGHVRYSTTGSLNLDQSQPLYTNTPYGLALSHNGNITNVDELKEILIKEKRHINSNSDSEILLNLFALKLNNIENIKDPECFFGIIEEIYKIVKGSYSVIIMINGYGLLAFKDPYGIRPLCFGKNDRNFIISSESVAIDINDFILEREINAGECIFISEKGDFFTKQIIKNPQHRICLFEYIYFSRPESIINKILVYQARKNMGEILGFKIKNQYEFIARDIDVVMPIPDSSRISALRLANVLNKPYCEGFIKNNYVGRTFIMPNQKIRQKSIKMKLNTIEQEFTDKNILIVDDSIVRGNTSIQLIKLAKKSGAKNIYFASVAPPVIYPNHYGIDIPSSNELIAYKKSKSEISQLLGSKFVIYNDLEDTIKGCNSIKIKENRLFETSCFDGNYIS